MTDISHYTESKADTIIDGLSNGVNIVLAAEMAGVCRATAFNWRKQYPDFAERWDDACERASGRLEGVVYEQAAAGNLAAAFYWLRHHKPAVYDRLTMAKLAMLNSVISQQAAKGGGRMTIQVDEHGIPHITENTQKRVVVYMPDNGRQRDKETEAIEAVVEKQPVMEHLC